MITQTPCASASSAEVRTWLITTREQSWSGITATCLMLICTCSPGKRTRQLTKARLE